MGDPLLKVRELSARVRTPHGEVRAVEGVSFDVRRGERLAIVGESGSGKTFTAMAITRLLPHNGWIESGSVEFEGRDLASLTEHEMTRYRGSKISMIFQDPVSSLNPLLPVGRQVAEGLIVHGIATKRDAVRIVPDLLEEVGLRDPTVVAGQYPFELSGGMAQRVSVAVALACRPQLLIADEPTTALDPTLQVQVLELLLRLSAERQMAIVLITHDMGVVRTFAERVVVMYAGQVAEDGPIDELLSRPTHPYTRGLIASMPGSTPRAQLPTIRGHLPVLTEARPGCLFEPRCSLGGGNPVCQERSPAATVVGLGHTAACHFAKHEVPGSSIPASVKGEQS